MKLKGKKLLSLAVSTALIITSLFIPKIDSKAAENGIKDGDVDRGTYGDTINYLYYKDAKGVVGKDSVLILDGKGVMPDVTYDDYEDNLEATVENGYTKPHYEKQGWYAASTYRTKEYFQKLTDEEWMGVSGELLINKLIIGGEISSIGENSFLYYGALNAVWLGKSVVNISSHAFFYEFTCRNVYIYGDLQEVANGAFDDDYKIHVINQTSADKVIASGVSSKNVVIDAGTDDTSLRISLKKAIIEQNKYPEGAGLTSGSWKKLTDAITDGQACFEADMLIDGITEEDVTAKAKAIDDAVSGLIPSKALDDALAEAAKLEGSDYTAESWAVLEKAVEAGKTGLKEAETAEEIASLAKAVNDAISGLVKLTADVAKADLAKVVAKTEGLVESDYSKKSWEALKTAMEGAEAVADSEVISEIATAAENLQKALDGLTVEYPTEWFSLAGMPSSMENWDNPVIVSILSGTVEPEMAGATKVEVTFDCAADTQWNEFTAVNFRMGGDFQEFDGKEDGSWQTGRKGIKVTMDLPSALTEGAKYNLEGYTQSWKGAAGNVFTFQKVRFLDADDIELKAVSSPKDVAEFLESAVKAAEDKLVDLEAGDYTEESIADFKAYLENLKSGGANDKLPSVINAILTKLKDVTTELQPSDNTSEMESLNKSIERAEALNKSDYTATSWSVLEKALTAAKKATESTVISEVKALNKAVEDAITGLKLADPSKTPDPNETPDPNRTPGPNETPNPSKAPGTNPTKVPTPTKNPGGPGTTKPTNPPSNIATGPKVGTKLTSGSYVYQVTKVATAKTEGTVTFTSLTKAGKKAGKLSIPDTATISGYKYQVTKLGNNAFKGAKAKSISLGKYINAIPKGAFAKCKKLKTLSIKAKLKSVKKGAFKGCKKKIKVKTSKKYKKTNIKLLKKSGYKKFK